jgi:hypothetical protein
MLFFLSPGDLRIQSSTLYYGAVAPFSALTKDWRRMMTDSEILERINAETQEEHDLLHAGEHGGIDETQRARLAEVKVSLDQLWDLLRQRRALRHAGLDPDVAKERSPSTVEHYKQ